MLHRIFFVLTFFVLCTPLQLILAGVQSKADAEWMEVEGVRLPVPPAEHPRLFLRIGDLDDLKRRVNHPVLAPVWADLQELGKLNTEYRVQVDAVRYLLTRDRALGRRTIQAALDTLTNCAFSARSDITRPIGRMLVAGAVVYDWCYELLSEDEKEKFVKQFVRLAEMLECGFPPRHGGELTGHQSEWMIMRDMLSAGVAAYDEYPELYRQAAKRIFSGLIPARDFWYPGHAFHQGTAYAETRFSSNLYPLWIFDRLGAGNVFHPSQQFVPYHWIYVRRPDGELLNAGDNESKVPKLRSLLCASYYGDGYVLSDYLKTPGIYGMGKLYELLWRDPDLKPLPLTDLPLSRYFGFPYGWMVARSGWQGESVVCEMKVNIYNFSNHQHQDAGAFQIYYKGPLAMDTGLYSGTSGGYISSHNVNYYKRTIAHNSLLIHDPDEQFLTRGFRQIEKLNDGGQRLPNAWAEAKTPQAMIEGDYKTGTVLGHGFGPDRTVPEYTYLKGDITEAYSGKVEQVQRSFVFLNYGGGPVPAALVVFDRVVASDPGFRKVWLLHSEEEPVLEGNTATVQHNGKRNWSGKLVNTTLLPLPGNTELTKVGGPGKEFWVDGRNVENKPRRDPERFEIGAWRVELSPRREAKRDLFLNVMQVTDRENDDLLDVVALEAEGLIGVKIGTRAVLLCPGETATNRPVSWQVQGAGTVKYLVAGLAAGNWQLWRDGRILRPAVEVSSDAGTIYFEGPAGSYQLRR
ncbi:heparin/heparin-sulfate lyase HepB [Gemmatimonadota bacterium]